MTSKAKDIIKKPRGSYDKYINGTYADIYDIINAHNITCPALAHAIKKMLNPGDRGFKDSIQDKKEAIASIQRSIDLEIKLKAKLKKTPKFRLANKKGPYIGASSQVSKTKSLRLNNKKLYSADKI